MALIPSKPKRPDGFFYTVLIAFAITALILTYIARGGLPHVWTDSEIRELVRDELAKQKK